MGPNGVPMMPCGTEPIDTCLDGCNGWEMPLLHIDDFLYRYYMIGPTSDLRTLPSDPRPDNRFAPFSQACRRGCTLTDTSPECSSGTTTGVTEVRKRPRSQLTKTLARPTDKHAPCAAISAELHARGADRHHRHLRQPTARFDRHH